jgi:hypothetical protein
MSYLASAQWELAADKPLTRCDREAAKVTEVDLLIAHRTLRCVQIALGVDDFPMGWKLPSGFKDNGPLAVRRTWFYALLRTDVGEPLFSIRKLARIANLSEKVIRNDLARMDAIVKGGNAYVSDFIQNVAEFVDDCVPLVTGASRYLDHMDREIAVQREEARKARAKARRPSPVPLLVAANDAIRASEVDAIMAQVARKREESKRRIDMAIINGDNATATEKRLARQRLDASVGR